MIFVDKANSQDPSWTMLTQDPEWAELGATAAERRQRLIETYNAGSEIVIDARFYGRFKRYLLSLFHGKCAYCETLITAAQPGDVEHFRPKKRVSGVDGKVVRVVDEKKGEIDHPGYYWLAYDWSNLLPSCNSCNRPAKHGKNLTLAGKGDIFPVEGAYVFDPDEDLKAAEKALLINPSEDKPWEHLEFFADGTLRAKTRKGEVTIDLLGLNVREDLVQERRRAYNEAAALFERYSQASAAEHAARKEETKEEIRQIKRGDISYSAFRDLAIKTGTAKLMESLSEIA